MKDFQGSVNGSDNNLGVEVKVGVHDSREILLIGKFDDVVLYHVKSCSH